MIKWLRINDTAQLIRALVSYETNWLLRAAVRHILRLPTITAWTHMSATQWNYPFRQTAMKFSLNRFYNAFLRDPLTRHYTCKGCLICWSTHRKSKSWFGVTEQMCFPCAQDRLKGSIFRGSEFVQTPLPKSKRKYHRRETHLGVVYILYPAGPY